ncbi:MAG: Arginase/agmatinase family enzyme [Candidatus Alkanophagales archaeon MCA70_species_2]|nr:Arginase/agmatinase family enzyme [Candidatus Alkanophaga liquidiphilum]
MLNMKFIGSLIGKDASKAEYGIFGIPFDKNSFIKGAKEGAAAIRAASHRLESFLWRQKLEVSMARFYDFGDVRALSYKRLHKRLNARTGNFKGRLIFLGGDHSVTLPVVKSLTAKTGKVKVISFDAHVDLRDSYLKNRFSNACVMRRVAEVVGFENIAEVGVRSCSHEEFGIIQSGSLHIYGADVTKGEGLGRVAEELADFAASGGIVHLSVDVDVLDPCYAPGVEDPEPEGLSVSELIYLIREIIKAGNVVSCDVVEVNPRLDVNELTSIIAAKIVLEILACFWEREAEG